MNTGLTDRQSEVLAFINRFRAREQCNPTCAEIASYFGWASANAASDHLKALSNKLVIVYRPDNKARGYVVTRGFETA